MAIRIRKATVRNQARRMWPSLSGTRQSAYHTTPRERLFYRNCEFRRLLFYVAVRNGGLAASDVLIDENRISVGVDRDKTGGARCILVCLVQHLDALRLELTLQFAHVRESS